MRTDVTDRARRASALSPFERLRRDTTPLDRKVTSAVCVALLAGVCIGAAEGAFGFRLWPAVALTAATAALLTKGAQAWIADPWHRLRRLLPGVAREHDRRPLSHLPTHREDEVGEIAGLIRDISGERISHRHESRQLRRTLDQRVQDATKRATSELKHKAHRDPLTGAGNRRYLDEQLPVLVDASRASDTELVAVMIDMDYFKQVNDQLGHAAGDDLLALLTDLLTASIRDDDLVVRLGGDEFLVLQPGGNVDIAQAFAHRVRRLYLQQTRQVAAALDDDMTPTLSVGVAGLHADGLYTGTALLNKADERVYQAKRAGRGRTATPLGLSQAA